MTQLLLSLFVFGLSKAAFADTYIDICDRGEIANAIASGVFDAGDPEPVGLEPCAYVSVEKMLWDELIQHKTSR